MNNGFFGFPSANSEGISKLTQFDSSGVYMILPRTKRIHIFAVGGGGGGGGGHRSTTTNCAAGGGGGGGGIVVTEYNVKDLGGIGVSLIINIGAGGVGGVGGATNGASGAIGSGSGSTQIYVAGKPGILINAVAGLPGNFGITVGSGGAATASTSFVSYNSPPISSLIGVGGGGGGAFAANSVTHSTFTVHGGAGGSGRGFFGAQAGGSVGNPSSTSFGVVLSDNAGRGSGLPGGIANPTTATNNSNSQINGVFSPGAGGPGGGAGTTTSAGNGGNGYRGSGGGGGGGSSANFTAGNGGNGGNGYVAIYAVI